MRPNHSENCTAKEVPSTTGDEERSTVKGGEMKRIRKEEKKDNIGWSEIRLAVEELSLLKKPNSYIGDQDQEKKVSTLAFLCISNLLLHVLDKLGPTMAVLRQDIQQNIERLQKFYISDPSMYSSLADILKKDAGDGTARKTDSCARAVLWLTRSLDFTLALLERVGKETDLRLAQVVEEAYMETLKPWHGWISSAAYRVALKLIPEREIFISLLLGKGQDCEMLQGDIKNLVSSLQPLLDEVHVLLRKHRLDRLKSN